MANQLEIAGSQHPEKPHHSAPLATTKIFTGYWPNSSPYRDAAVPFLYEKFYGATRNDKIGAGLNTEISPRMTLVRRPGCPVWNSNSFTNVTGFYSFRPFQAGVGEQAYVIADTAAAVYIAAQNGIPCKVLLYTKGAGAGKSRFQGTGNTLYWGDGNATMKWSWFPAWDDSTTYPAGTTVLDSIPGNFQLALGYGVQVVSTSVTSNVATITYSGAGSVNTGDNVKFYGLTTATGLNGSSLTVLSAASNQFTVTYNTANYGTTSDTGVVVDSTRGSGTSGGSQPSFSSTIQSVLIDGTVAWQSWGSSVQNLGIVAPTQSPGSQVTSVPSAPTWSASTYYWPEPFIVDSNSTPYVWQLVTDGTTNGSLPSGLSSGSPTPQYSGGNTNPSPTQVTDGTAVWQCNSLATRATATAYSAGQVIAVSWTYTYYTYEYTGGGGGRQYYCFSGNVGVKTPDGFVPFDQLPREPFDIVNENGIRKAQLLFYDYKDDVLDLGNGKLVTPTHLFKQGNEWIPAEAMFPNAPRRFYVGRIYDLHVVSVEPSDHHFIIDTGHTVHNADYIQIPHSVTYDGFFMCTAAGTTSSAATSTLPWAASLNATMMDGTVTWQNIGQQVTRTASSTAAPSGGGQSNMVAGNVSNSTKVTHVIQISDSNSNGETPVVAGLSGASAPSWASTIGSQTIDNSGLTWSNQGVLGKANTANWYYTFTYVNPVTFDESTAAPLSAAILLPASSGVIVSGPGSSDTQVGQINIYRTTQVTAPGTPFFLRSILAPTNGQSWSFTDTTPDPPNAGAILNDLITAPGFGIVNGVVVNRNDPPPAGLTNLEFHAGRMWGTVGNIAYFSTGADVTSGNGNTAWDVENFYETPGTMYRFWSTTVGLFVYTNDGLWIIQGLGTSTNPFQEIQSSDPALSIASYDAFSFNGTQAQVYTTDRLYVQVDPQNGTSFLGEPVATDLIAGYAPSSVYLTYYSNGLDQKGFITNGSNQWLSWMQVPAPETGYLWNPPAITTNGSAGVGAIASVETQPGSFTLLVGPSGTGPILMRDSTNTTFADNGNEYESWAAFGNIVFAHHGQMAGIIHVGADFIRIGSQPGLSVLLDEVLNVSSTPPWVDVPNPVNDPPNLPASKSLYQLRYWMNQTQQPIFCRNGLFRFDFGMDTIQNELLAFTIFGENLHEDISS